MLTIFVTPRKQTVMTADGKRMRVFPLMIKEGGKLHCFHEREDYSAVDDVEILTRPWYLAFCSTKLVLTPETKKALVEFLHCYHAKVNMTFDCYAFACLVAGIPPDLHNAHWGWVWDQWWETSGHEAEEEKGKPGNIVFLLDADLFFRHAAIYVGFGMYVSVYGGGGDVEIATLADMKKDYGASKAILVRPK